MRAQRSGAARAFFERLAPHWDRVRSLHAPEDALRSRIMPVNDRYPLAEVLEACTAFYAVCLVVTWAVYVRKGSALSKVHV